MGDTVDTKFSSIPLIEDQPIGDLQHDYLGLMPWAKMIAGSLVGTRGPFTVGVHGEWGYGKTSLLRLTKALIEDQHPDVVTVWFNAWQFEREEHPLFPLIAAIADEIENKTAKGKHAAALGKIGASIRALTRGMKFTGEVGMPLVGKVGVEFDAAKALEAEELIGSQSNPLLGEMMYHSAFEMLEKVAREESGVKIAVFIDDLDRCQPDKAVALLESIKLILAQPGFVFALAVDPRPIEGFLQKRYREHFDGKETDWGRFYMEKIIQLPIHIPSHRTRFQRYVDQLIGELVDKPGIDGVETDALLAIRDVLATGACTNPRSLVRLVNNFLLDCNLWPLIPRDKYDALDHDVAAALVFNRILEHLLGDMYEVLIGDQKLCDAIGAGQLQAYVEPTVMSIQTDVPMKLAPDKPEVMERIRAEQAASASVAKKLFAHREIADALWKHGSTWLEERELRVAVHEFAQTQRATGTAPDFEEHIAKAIRYELSLEDGEPIPLDRLREVKSLDLPNARVTNEELQQLKPLTGLRELNLGGSQVTATGIQHLQMLTGLFTLYLGGTQVTEVELQQLKTLTSLQALGLRNRKQVNDEGLQHLTALTNLRWLDLSNCTQVSDTGLHYLGALTSLQWLSLNGTGVTDEGLHQLKTLTALQTLHVSRTRVTEAGAEELRKSIRGLRVDRK